MVRAAILYADEVELVSLTAEMIASLAAVANALEDVLAKAPDKFRARLASLLDGSLRDAQETLSLSGVQELWPAMDAGIVRLTPIMPAGGSSHAITEQIVAKITEYLMSTDIHLLFDDSISSLARGLISEGGVVPSRLVAGNAGEAAVGTGFVTRLPAFDQVPISELLDLRDDLTDPLTRYRRSVAQMASRMTAGPFDAEISADIDNLYRTEVEPALLDLREGMAEHGLVREVVRGAAADIQGLVSGVTGSVVILGAASMTDLAGWVTAAAAGPTSIAAAQVTVSAAKRRKEGRARHERHDLFYLYEIDRRTTER